METEIITVSNVRGYIKDEVAYLNAEDVARGLGWTKTEKKGDKEYTTVRWDRVDKYLGIATSGERPEYITKKQLRRLIQSTNRVIDKQWYALAGLAISNVIITKEQETIGFIVECFKNVTQVNLQHRVGNYKVDLYFPEYNISVECDELAHSDRDINEEVARESYIKEKLGCKFVRFNPDANGFSISSVISEINEFIFNTKNNK